MCDQPDTTSIISSDAPTYSTSDEPMSTVLSDFITTTNGHDYSTSDEPTTMADDKYTIDTVNTTLTTSQGVSSTTYNRSDEPATLLSSSNDITTRNVDDTDMTTTSGGLDSFTTVNDDVSVTSASSTSLMKCSCPCMNTTNQWEYLKSLNLTKEQLIVHLSGHLTKLKNEISVSLKSTSSYKATKVSAGDTRGSSQMMGVIGIVVICLMLFLLISADIMKLLIYCVSCKNEKDTESGE